MGAVRVSDIARLASSKVVDREAALREALEVDSQRALAMQTWLLGALVAVPLSVVPVYFADGSKMPEWAWLVVMGLVIVILVGLVWQAVRLRNAARTRIHAVVLLKELEALAPLILQFGAGGETNG